MNDSSELCAARRRYIGRPLTDPPPLDKAAKRIGFFNYHPAHPQPMPT